MLPGRYRYVLDYSLDENPAPRPLLRWDVRKTQTQSVTVHELTDEFTVAD